MASGLEGTFKDYKNNWSCGSLDEWREHLADTETTGKLKNGKTYPDVLCEECKNQ